MTARKLRKTLLKSIPLETERLILRYIAPSDADDMFEYSSIEDVCEYLLWSPHINIDVTKGYIEFLQKRYLRGLYADWAIIIKDTGKMIGTCGYANIDTREKSCEIGYVLSPYYRNKGYMTESVRAVLKLTFEVLNLQSAHLRIINENASSKKLAERVGFSLDRIGYSEMEIKGQYRDIVHYIMTDEMYNRIKEKNEAV
jgi:ribosomal-protein-alanine N-acetyltransferase